MGAVHYPAYLAGINEKHLDAPVPACVALHSQSGRQGALLPLPAPVACAQMSWTEKEVCSTRCLDSAVSIELRKRRAMRHSLASELMAADSLCLYALSSFRYVLLIIVHRVYLVATDFHRA